MAGWKRVVVGVDGSDCSRRALQWAVEEAGQRGAEVVAVMAWTPARPPIASPEGPPVPWDHLAEPEKEAKFLLEHVIAEELGGSPAAKVTATVKEGHPAKILTDLSRDADLLVVGTRGHGGFVGLLLGSVSQHVSAHAPCSVVVIR